jgi:uracil phosphoribosyltransferase
MLQYPNLTVLSSRAVENLMGLIRDKSISREQFRMYSRRIIRFIIEETLALECDIEVKKESPLGYYKTRVNRRRDDDYVAISILRSGNSMVDELLIIMPGINVGQILVQRDETTKEKKAIFYFEKLPDDLADKKMLLLDPMLATGGSATAAIEILLNKGVKEENILFLNFVSCVDGIDIMLKKFPKMKIITSKVDPYLLPNKYIAPGLGDFGDRYYGTLKKD